MFLKFLSGSVALPVLLVSLCFAESAAATSASTKKRKADNPPGERVEATPHPITTFSFNLMAQINPTLDAPSTVPARAAALGEKKEEKKDEKKEEGETTYKNEVISGYSVYSALGLAYMGTGEKSAAEAEIARALGVSSREQFATDYTSQMNSMTGGGLTRRTEGTATTAGDEHKAHSGPTIQTANQIVVANEIPVKPEFKQAVSNIGAAVQFLDFRDEAKTLKTINDWVSEKTMGRIPTILSELGREEVMFILNAIYFKGAWSTPFYERGSEKKSFHMLSGGTKTVTMMQSSEKRWSYFADRNGQAVELPYKGSAEHPERDRFSMIVYLPSSGRDHFVHAQKTMRDKEFQQLIAKMKYQKGTIHLPKFKVESTYDLRAPLMSMGMVSMFSVAPSTFAGIATAPSMGVSRVIHKTFIEVDEKGTEAAAVTAMGAQVESMSLPDPTPPFEFKADRPFLFFIRDSDSGIILFQGWIVDP